jgi:S-methylmethionine-dependent homocysteine/selenocysteine methylase
LEDTLNFIKEHNPLAIGINCISLEHYEKAFKSLDVNINWGFYLNCGFDEHHVNEIKCRISPKIYVEIVKKYFEYQPSFIGACCGSSPEHIKAIKRILDE